MKLSSSAFESGAMIPQKYGRNFANVNPPFEIIDAPETTKSFVLFMEDPDVPLQAGVPVWDHWVAFNIPGSTRSIPENWKVDGIRGRGTRGELDYGGPRPPDREHRYFFKLFALDSMLDLAEGATKAQLQEAMQDHILDSAELMGRYAPSI